MNLPAQLFANDWLWLANFVFGFLLYRAVREASWRNLLDNSIMVHALTGLLFGAFVFWQFNAGIRPGFNFHILGSTLFLLMFGWQVATVSITLVMLATWLRTDMALVTLGINGLLMIAIPVLFSDWLLRFSKRHLPKNLFLFVLWNGFFCSMLSIVLNVLVTTLLLLLLSRYSWEQIQHYYLVATPILMLTEGFVTGMLITAFTVFQPQAVLNFSDAEYLEGK
ncbi:energy-coupling factor ABC transporter permease [Sideroxydans lithotrophicus]|uniref:Putative integral membrane protein n=1 Tax=Sideroxydans lithotrophicus (strain ES-1) TaxID=580332 RepID=D5CTD0_SIDLE|nr:energy-coupling factor ABC transporter permease [Sideroxydans lithotrophicus]ADE12216.1 putative integral membrane protein [Sideroxydans lithotrophicus ES-1]